MSFIKKLTIWYCSNRGSGNNAED